MDAVERKAIEWEVKADKEQRLIEGYASVFDVVDRVNDVVLPGAFASSLTERKGRIVHLLHHDPTRPIGRPELAEDSRGLHYRTRVSKTRDGDEALELAADGALTGNSIGFRIPKGGFRAEVRNGVHLRLLDRIDLVEITSTTPGVVVNEHAGVIRVLKSLSDARAIDLPSLLALKSGIDQATACALLTSAREQKGATLSYLFMRLIEAHLEAISPDYDRRRIERVRLIDQLAREAGLTPGLVVEVLQGGVEGLSLAQISAMSRVLGQPVERLEAALMADQIPQPEASGSESIGAEAIKSFRRGLRASEFKGRRLASLLRDLIDARIDDERPHSFWVQRMASEAGISDGTVGEILMGTIDCPPRARLEGFARAFDIPLSRVLGAAAADGCSEPEEEAADLSAAEAIKSFRRGMHLASQR